MGDFNAHIGLGIEQRPNTNGPRLLNLVWACELVIGNELPQCQGRWTWEREQKRSVIDYILFSRVLVVKRVQIEDSERKKIGSDYNLLWYKVRPGNRKGTVAGSTSTSGKNVIGRSTRLQLRQSLLTGKPKLVS